MCKDLKDFHDLGQVRFPGKVPCARRSQNVHQKLVSGVLRVSVWLRFDFLVKVPLCTPELLLDVWDRIFSIMCKDLKDFHDLGQEIFNNMQGFKSFS